MFCHLFNNFSFSSPFGQTNERGNIDSQLRVSKKSHLNLGRLGRLNVIRKEAVCRKLRTRNVTCPENAARHPTQIAFPYLALALPRQTHQPLYSTKYKHTLELSTIQAVLEKLHAINKKPSDI